MKKIGILLLILACVIGCTGCFCSHEWLPATCLEAQKCPLCGKTEGEALGHRYLDATCQAPQTCEICGQTQGEAVDHKWDEATCSAPKSCHWCGKTEGEALEHSWINATTEKPKTCSACGTTEGDRIITDPRFTTAANSHLFGDWQMETSVSGEELSLGDYVDEVSFIATVTFGEDGSLKIKLNFKDLDAFLEELTEITQEIMYAEFENMDISREEAEQVFADAYGMSIAEYCENTWAVVDWNAMLEMYGVNFVYYEENGSIYLADNWESDFSASTYTLAGDLLTIVDPDGTTLELTRAK